MPQWALAVPQGRGVGGNHHAHTLSHRVVHAPAVVLQLGMAGVLGVKLLAAQWSRREHLDCLGHAIPALNQVDREPPPAVLDLRASDVGRTVAELMRQTAAVGRHVGRACQALTQIPNVIAIF